MKLSITNTSKAPQGVHTTTGLQFVPPGETRELDVADDYVERVRALPYLSTDEPAQAAVDAMSRPDLIAAVVAYIRRDVEKASDDELRDSLRRAREHEAWLAHQAGDDDDDDDDPAAEDLGKLTIPQLKERAEAEKIDLGDASKKAEIIAAITAGRAGADRSEGATEDPRSDDELRAAVIEQLGADGAADLDRAAMIELLKPKADA